MTERVFYHPEMFSYPDHSFSTTQSHAGELLDTLLEKYPPGLFNNSVYPLSQDDLLLAHSSKYIEQIFSSKEMYELIPCLLRGGSVVSAILSAYENKTSTFSPSAGYHHAMYGQKGTFCTFNSVMVGLILLIKRNGAKRIGYIDLDNHFSDGVHDIIAKLDMEKYFAIYDFTKEGFSINAPTTQIESWLNKLDKELSKTFLECDFIYLYHGYDSHLEDPLGGILSTTQIEKRDRIVFNFLNRINIPYSWCLGGGYLPINQFYSLFDQSIKHWTATNSLKNKKEHSFGR